MTATTAADLGSGHAGSVNRHFACFDGFRRDRRDAHRRPSRRLRLGRHLPVRMGRLCRPDGHRRADLLRALGVPALPSIRVGAVRGHATHRQRRLLDPARAAHLPRVLGGAVPAGDPGRHRRAQPVRAARVHEPHADLLHAVRDRCHHAVVEPRDRDELLRVPAVLGPMDAQARRHEHDQRPGDAAARVPRRPRRAVVRVAGLHLLARPELEAAHVLLAAVAHRALLRRDGAGRHLGVGRPPLGGALRDRRDRPSPRGVLVDRDRAVLVRVHAARPVARALPGERRAGDAAPDHLRARCPLPDAARRVR